MRRIGFIVLLACGACGQGTTPDPKEGVALCDPWPCGGVWIDIDGDRELDESEPAANVAGDGRFALPSEHGDLRAWASAPNGARVVFLSPPGETIVSPLTSLVEAKRTLGSFSDVPLSVLDARDAVCAKLNKNCASLLADYRGDTEVASLAGTVSESLAANWAALEGESPPAAISALAWQWVVNHLDSDGAPTLVAIPPSATGRRVVMNYEGIPASVREHLPKYTNAYVSEIEGFDYRKGVAILGARDVGDREMLRTRDVVNAMLLVMGDARRGLVEYQSFIGVLKKEPGGSEEKEGFLKALLRMRPLELIYTDPHGDGTDNEAGLDGVPEATTHHILQLLAYYAMNNAAYFADIKRDLLSAYRNAIEQRIYEPRDKYLEPDVAHPGILTAPGAYLALAGDVYYGIEAPSSVEEAEYHVADREDMADKDPLMYELLSTHFDREWFDYDRFVRPEDGYVPELRRLDSLGVLDDMKDGRADHR